MNFIAFRFRDNDFHEPLRKAIEYVIEQQAEELTIANFRLFVLRGMSAFDALRRIDNEYASRILGDHTSYFDDNLEVKELRSLAELDTGFEGYIFNKNTLDVFYSGY